MTFILFASPVHSADRYVALFEDGARVTAPELKDWNDPAAHPRIADRALFDPARPMRWLIDRQQWPLQPPTQFVEFTGGDRLVGEVIAAQSGRESAFEQFPPHLLVRTAGDLQPPDDPEAAVVRVLLDSVQRVAWEARALQPHRPGTAFLRHGGEIAFRSVRWEPTGVALLVDDGVKELTYFDLAELHLPARDAWDAYADELTVLAPNGEGRLLQWHTVEGNRFTASTLRYQPRHWGDKNRSDSWLQLIQPAWSLDPLWLRFRTIHTCRSWTINEPPLSRFGPHTATRTAVFSSGWPWQRDRNTQGQRLQIGGLEFAGGFGVHASTDLTFRWPPFARAVRVSAGIDPAAGTGGCVNLSILAADSHTLFQRGPIIGSKEVVETGWVAVPHSTDASTLTLRADMATDNRPAGADPLDIRDVVNWCDPQVQIDVAALHSSHPKNALAAVSGLVGWTAEDRDEASLQTTSIADVTDARDPRYRVLFRTTDPFVILSRSLKIAADDRWLSLVVSRFSEHAPSFVQVKLNGVSCGEFEVPLRQGPIDPDAVTVPVDEHQGNTVSCEVVVYPTAENSWLDWRGIGTTRERPGVRTLFEDEYRLAREDRAEHSDTRPRLLAESRTVELATAGPFSGAAALRVAPGEAARFDVPDTELVIAEHPKLGQFHFVAFAWRGENAGGLSLQFAHEGRFGSQIADALIGRPGLRRPVRNLRGRRLDDRGLRYGYAYDAGGYQPLTGSPLRLDREVSEKWELESRDIYNDFGLLTLTGFGVQCHERGAGFFDHIYLARTPQDLEYIKTTLVTGQAPSADDTYSRKATRAGDWGPAVASFAPAFATREAPHGILQKREHFGQADGWQTHPIDNNKPFVLRTGVHLPSDRPQELDLRVSHQPEHDWRLVVRVNGERMFETLVNDELTRPQRGWASLQVDLSRFRGQKVLLEVLNESNDGKAEHAFWKRVVLRDITP